MRAMARKMYKDDDLNIEKVAASGLLAQGAARWTNSVKVTVRWLNSTKVKTSWFNSAKVPTC